MLVLRTHVGTKVGSQWGKMTHQVKAYKKEGHRGGWREDNDGSTIGVESKGSSPS